MGIDMVEQVDDGVILSKRIGIERGSDMELIKDESFQVLDVVTATSLQ